ncbi:MAG: amylo-alpha-1,6-glucosidase [Minisyncoccia bacterium]
MHAELWKLGEQSIRELETDRGILASSKSEIYGCIFGRDSLITALALLKVYEKTHDEYYRALVGKILANLADLQGHEVNIESGEEPGKIIHEYRPEYHEHLTIHTVHMQKPWYLYPDNVMRSYDTADATALFLMASHAYYRVGGDVSGIETNIRAALQWMRDFGDINGDGLFDYHVHPDRTCGGLVTQSWMDSSESIFFENRAQRPRYPIAPVEVQAYSFVALRAWADYFTGRDAELSLELSGRATALKKKFNEVFVLEGKRGVASLAFAIDGEGNHLESARSSMGHVLWASWKSERGAMPESVLDQTFVAGVARRLLKPDLYVPRAGIRTLSRRSSRYDPHSYHNGSIWPHDTAIVADGLENFGFREEAKRVRAGLMTAYSHFKTPIELFVYKNGRYREYCDERGQGACRVQAWSAASLLAALTETNVA